jgi:modulator of FtsH protease HflC
MKRNYLTMTVGCLLLLICALLLFVFQVRVTDIAIVTTFGNPTREPLTKPGPYFKWPWPIQKVTTLDKRIQNFEDKFEETLTQDGRPLLITVYAGWKIADARLFYDRFAGSVTAAERSLEDLIRSAKGEKVGQHAFGDFISTDEKNLQFVKVEQEILGSVQPRAQANYGIEIQFLHIKKLQLPASITQKVFDRMQAERKKVADTLLAQGEEQSKKIHVAADFERDKVLAKADADAMRIRSEGDAEAAKSFKVFAEQPELAIFLYKLTALELVLKERATLILDNNTPPFDLLKETAIKPPGSPAKSAGQPKPGGAAQSGGDK